ncbi:MAG TPA: aminopeptidase [Patescibacteria group bacterium]|nr:aminopeptidase [Patescibacteria group bacterium]
MKPANLGDYYRLQCAALERLAKTTSPWQGEALELLGLAYRETENADELLDILHRIQRLHKVAIAGLADNPFFLAAVQDVALPLWGDFGSPPVPLDLQDSLAAKLYNCVPGDTALISLGDGARQIGLWLIEKCRASGVHFLIVFADPVFDVLVINHADETGVKALSDDFLKLTGPATKRIVARAGLPDTDPPTPDETKQRQFDRALKPYSDRLRSGNLFYTLTSIPTPRDAEVDGIPYEDYIKLFFEMCDQPWDRIGRAQEKLIGEFNAAEEVRITNADGTDLRMNIKGFTFCNSLIAKNVPGSEIFSAPRRDSVEGIIVAKGRFSPPGTKRGIIENLTMEFKGGHLENFKADSGVELFANAVSIDEGARWVGELGIGTNPHLRKHVLNGLLVEKIGGSFHVALGACYSFKEYAGIPVNVDNGNQSALHWDVTTMLHGRQGQIWLDGRPVMDDGLWLDKAYDVLNRGWKSVPVDERPEYWKNY